MTTYAISELGNLAKPIRRARVDSINAARLWLAAKCEEDKTDPELIFEIDPHNDAADAAIVTDREIILYTIEPEKE